MSMSQAPNMTATELLGVPPPAQQGRDRLVQKAINLFYTHGFNAVGLDRVLDEVGVTKTAFYKHFESKDDLVVAAIKKRDEWETQAWIRAVRKLAGDDPRAQLLAFIDVLDIWFNDPIYGGCMFINAAVEFPNPHDPVHQAAAAHKLRMYEQFGVMARAAGVKDVDRFADQFTMLIEGTLIMRHVYHRNDAAKVARGVAERMLDEFIVKPKPRQRARRRVSK